MITEYTQKYFDFIIALNQSLVITQLSVKLLHDFPNNLPDVLATPYHQTLASIIERLSKAEDEHHIIDLNLEFINDESHIAPFITLVIAHAQIYQGETIDFNKAITAKQLVMIFAHLDAFMADSLRMICRIQPQVMKSSKTVTWETMIDAGTWDSLLDIMIDSYVADFVKPNVAKRVEFMSRQLGLLITISQKETKLLEEAENLRHCFVHNGGRVDSSLLKKLQRNDLILGSEIHIDTEYLEEIYRIAFNLAGHIFKSISEKFLGFDSEKNILPVWTTGVNKNMA